jgi:hypothetical protein
LAAGRLDVDAVLTELSARKIREWEAFFLLEPFGQEWQQTALLASLIAETNRDHEKREEPYALEEFLPVPPQEDEPDDEADYDDDDWPDMQALAASGEPAWMRWRHNMRAYALATNPIPTPNPSPER